MEFHGKDIISSIVYIISYIGVGIFSGLLLGFWLSGKAFNWVERQVGIQEIKHCRIDIPGCNSNWWEIVWIDKGKSK